MDRLTKIKMLQDIAAGKISASDAFCKRRGGIWVETDVSGRFANGRGDILTKEEITSRFNSCIIVT